MNMIPLNCRTTKPSLGRITIAFLASFWFCLYGLTSSAVAQIPPFNQIIVFGDSLSDTGNVRDRTNERSQGVVDYPSHTFNYSNGRFTNDNETDPSSNTYVGVWHEQLAATFLGRPPATFSLGGGLNFAFGGALTTGGTHEEVAVSTPLGDVTITVDDMGKQVDDYLAGYPINPSGLYIVYGGANDLRNDETPPNVTATAARITALVSRLVNAGARYMMVPNLPPLGLIPRYSNDPARVAALNTASINFRQELNADLATLQADLAAQGINFTLYSVDAWLNTIRLFSDATRFGLTNLTDPAQDNSGANPDQFAFWDDVHPTTAGHYQIAKTANDAVNLPPSAPSRALNISTRVLVGTGEQVSIAGFMVTGTTSKKVLIRGIGPSLTGSGITNPLVDPNLSIADQAGTPILTNDNWRATQEAEISATGIPPQNDLESAIVATLQPGHYTAVIAGRDNGVGVGLIEIYDLEPTSTTATLANLSTRGFVGTDNDVMIGGVIIGDGDSPLIVLRGIGPSLAQSGIANPLLDPMIELYDVNGSLLLANDNWSSNQMPAINAAQLAPTDDHESAIITPFLTPGNYTASRSWQRQYVWSRLG